MNLGNIAVVRVFLQLFAFIFYGVNPHFLKRFHGRRWSVGNLKIEMEAGKGICGAVGLINCKSKLLEKP